MEDRRSSTRQLTCIPAYFDSRGESPDQQDLALIRDVSISGARLLTRVRLEPDEEVRLGLYLGSEADGPRLVKARARRVERLSVARADLWHWEIGVEFDPPIAEFSEEIEALCRRQEAAGVLKR